MKKNICYYIKKNKMLFLIKDYYDSMDVDWKKLKN